MKHGLRSIAAACIAVAMVSVASPALAQQKVLKFIPQADLRILDPIATTAYITRNHGYMVYDTLFSIDSKFQVKPQMVDKYELSKDKLTYTFTLRDGLKFHDGAPVRSADCIASVERWAKRDALGQKLAEAFKHVGLSVRAFGVGELLSARYLAIPFAGNASLGEALLDEGAAAASR